MVRLLVMVERPVAAILALCVGGGGGGPDDGGGDAIVTVALALLHHLGLALHLVGHPTTHHSTHTSITAAAAPGCARMWLCWQRPTQHNTTRYNTEGFLTSPSAALTPSLPTPRPRFLIPPISILPSSPDIAPSLSPPYHHRLRHLMLLISWAAR